MQLPSFSMPRRPCRTPKPPSAPPVSNFLVFSLEVQKFGDFTNLEDWNVLTSDAAQSYRPITNQSINHHRLPPDQHESKIPDGEAVSQDQTLAACHEDKRVAWFSWLVFSVFSVFSMDLNQKTHRKKKCCSFSYPRILSWEFSILRITSPNFTSRRTNTPPSPKLAISLPQAAKQI